VGHRHIYGLDHDSDEFLGLTIPAALSQQKRAEFLSLAEHFE